MNDKSEQFIHELHKQCEEGGQLRKEPDTGGNDAFAQLLVKAQSLFSKNKILKGIDLITEVLEAHLPMAQNFLDELISFRQRYTELQKKVDHELATDTDKANLRQAVFNCIKLIPQISKGLGL